MFPPAHGEVVPADKLPGVMKTGVLGEWGIAAQVAQITVLPEDPDGNGLQNELQHVPGLLEFLGGFLQLPVFFGQGLFRPPALGDIPDVFYDPLQFPGTVVDEGVAENFDE